MPLEDHVATLRDGPPADVCRLLGESVREMRIQAGETQAALAGRAGVPLRTYRRLESDGSGTLETFVQVLVALGRTQYLIYLFPRPLPKQQPTLGGRVNEIRQRVLFNRQGEPPKTDGSDE